MPSGIDDPPREDGLARPDPDTTRDAPEPTLPTVIPPQTKSPVQLNQQVNLSVYQIPPSAWDRLSPEQVVEISKEFLKQADASDQRQFDFAKDQIKREESGKKMAILCGSIVAIAIYGLAGWLSLHNHESVALVSVVMVTTVIAMIVGNRFLD